MNRAALGFVMMFLLLLPVTEAQEYDFEYDVPFVPTRNEVVTAMLSMVKVTRDDIVYDLGCGDGRIVITAAKMTGCRGVGIDINPIRISESRANAEKAQVADKVRFAEQNLFDADIHEATVVTLYLLPAVNLKLRPNLIRQLKPGTRIVSHNYAMGDWDTDNYKEVELKDSTHDVYFWVVPANVSGVWRISIQSAEGNSEYKITLNQKFQHVFGDYASGSLSRPLQEFKITGDSVIFSLEDGTPVQPFRMEFRGKATGDSMSGAANKFTGQWKKEGTWKAVREAGTAKPIDTGEK